MVSLRPIDDANREAVEALEVSPDQEQFVSNVADSLREAAREPDGRALYWAIYADESAVSAADGALPSDFGDLDTVRCLDNTP